MNDRHPDAIRRMLLVFGAAAMSVFLLPTSAQAQAGPPPSMENPDPFADMRERRNREAALRSAEAVPGKSKDDPRRAQAIAERMKEDFRNLQVVRNEMVRALKTGKPLGYKSIAAETAAVHKSASRLKAALNLDGVDAEDERSAQVALGEEQMRAALVNLCNGIIGFVESPVLKSPGVANVKEVAEARRALRNIIVLSGGIRRSAEALRRTGK